MPTLEEQKRNLETIHQAAQIPAQVVMCYKKSAIDIAPERVVEPYALAQGKQDMMLRAYQTHPAEGWRFFMVHRIDQARQGDPFKPRRKVTIVSGEISEQFTPYVNWDAGVMRYRDAVVDTLADMEVSRAEQELLDRLRGELKIRPEAMLGVHFSIFHACLGTILSDGLIDDHEYQLIRDLNECLKKCGAGVC